MATSSPWTLASYNTILTLEPYTELHGKPNFVTFLENDKTLD